MVVWMVGLFACGTPEAPPAPAAGDPAANAAEAGMLRTARVLEVLDGGGYTFARMDACGQEAWVAGPPAEMYVGQAVDMRGGAGMERFHSPALGRTFDQILFVDSWSPAAKDPVCEPTGAAPPAGLAVPEGVRIGKVLETMNAAGYTYARVDVCGTELWIAAPETAVKVDTLAAFPEGVEMKDFQSAALERTFATVLFVDWVKRSRVDPVCPK